MKECFSRDLLSPIFDPALLYCVSLVVSRKSLFQGSPKEGLEFKSDPTTGNFALRLSTCLHVLLCVYFEIKCGGKGKEAVF